MDPLVVELALAETAAVRRRVTSAARVAMAAPVGLLGIAWLVLVPAALIVGRNHLAPFVGTALLAITALAWRQYHRIASASGVQPRLWPWLAFAAAALLGGMAASRTGTTHGLAWLNLAGPFDVNAIGLAALAWLVRSRVLAGCAAGIVLLSIGASALLTGDAAVASELGGGALLLLITAGSLAR